MSELTTFLFLDLVGSVELKRQMPGGSDTERDAAYISQILTPHRLRIETLLPGSGGRVVSTAGDSHFLVFADTIRAARWALALQDNHHSAPIFTPSGAAIALRMSLHVGVPQIDPSDPHNFVGKAVDYAARLNDLAAADQILVSRAVVAILEDAGLDGVRFMPQGDADLKGIGRTPLFELLSAGASPKSVRRAPREQSLADARWRVVPPTMGLSQFGAGGSGGSSRAATAIGGFKRLGNYELVRLIGAGGMGNVYEARHTQFARRRAVKVIKPMLVDNGAQEIVRRFYREIKAIGALEHPNVVVAIDSSAPSDPVHYLVMEYLDGVTTDELAQRHGPLKTADACEIIRQAAVGLEYIHKQGLVHRDLKPSNLMLTVVEASSNFDSSKNIEGKTPVVKILDLGLALLVGDDQSRLTQFGHGAMGTGMYMAPEQWKTASVDIRADIYSLGCSLYHLLAGRPPFYESDLRPEKAHEKEPPPPIRGRTDLPPELEAILTRMMAKTPAERFDRPLEVAAALSPHSVGHALTDLAQRYTSVPSNDPTHPGAGSDTLLGSSDPLDTIGPAPSAPRPLWSPAEESAPTRRRWLAYLLPIVALAGFGAAVGLGTFAQRQHAKLLNSHEKHLEFVANSAAEALESEIAQRQRLLADVAGDGNLRAALELVAQQPADRLRWEQVQRLIEKRKVANDESLPAESWFVTDAQGMQIARAPESKETIGQSFADRDYFHGQGLVPPKEAAPIREAHRSGVYRSKSSRKLKVAFSAPIFSADRESVLGVLGMSLNLGDFAELENRKDLEEAEVLLIDLRADDQPGGEAGGLILHAPELERFDRPEHPPRLPADLVALVKQKLSGENPGARGRNRLLADFPDIFGRDSARYWAAFQPVQSEEDPGEPAWVVLVQEVKP